MYDVIGDIHGYADELENLLEKLGYSRRGGSWSHKERKVIFLGDFIDRGPKIKEVLNIVRPMVDSQAALAVMGNHEFNAIAFHTQMDAEAGLTVRPRTNKNILQHVETIRQLSGHALDEAVEWFRTLPLWIDLPELRVVHACWDQPMIDELQGGISQYGDVTDRFIRAACTKGDPLFHAAEAILKGKEIRLPEGVSFMDKDGHQRHHIRTRWYLSPHGITYSQYSFQGGLGLDSQLDQKIVKTAVPYPVNDKPVFFGHYWLRSAMPSTLTSNVACVDYSVAMQGGFLCAYRWNGECELRDENFVWSHRL